MVGATPIIVYRSQAEVNVDAALSTAEAFVFMVCAAVFIGITAAMNNLLVSKQVGNRGFKVKVSLAVGAFAAIGAWFFLMRGL